MTQDDQEILSRKRPGSPVVAFRAGLQEEALAARIRPGVPADDLPGQYSMVARRDLERYYALLERELAQLHLSEGEALLLCDAGNGLLSEPQTMQLLWAQVDDAIRLEGLDRKWDVDGPALVAQLRALTPGQAFAVTDAIERFWTSADADSRDTVRAVGLVRQERTES